MFRLTINMTLNFTPAVMSVISKANGTFKNGNGTEIFITIIEVTVRTEIVTLICAIFKNLFTVCRLTSHSTSSDILVYNMVTMFLMFR